MTVLDLLGALHAADERLTERARTGELPELDWGKREKDKIQNKTTHSGLSDVKLRSHSPTSRSEKVMRLELKLILRFSVPAVHEMASTPSTPWLSLLTWRI